MSSHQLLIPKLSNFSFHSKTPKNLENHVDQSFEECPYNPDSSDHDLFYDESRGEVVCRLCGVVINNKIPIATQKYNQNFSNNEYSNNRLSSFTKHKMYNKLSPQMKRIFKLDKNTDWQKDIRPKKIRGIVRNMLTLINFENNFYEETLELVNKAVKLKVFNNKPHRLIALVAIKSVLTTHRITKNLKPLMEIYNISEQNFRKAFYDLRKCLNLPNIVLHPTNYVEELGRKLKIDPNIILKAYQILGKIQSNINYSGKKPQAYAAAIFKILSEENGMGITQKKIAEVAKITEITLRKAVRAISKFLNQKNQPICFL